MSKAFDSLYQPLMLAKLKAYGVSDDSAKLLDSYFTDRHCRVKLGSIVSGKSCPGNALGYRHLGHSCGTFIRMFLLTISA